MSETLRCTCVIAGGGPAGVMLGYLLARAGVHTVVLEKHRDFLRDFRGDTVHPSTLEVMDQLGLLDDFLQRPHQQLDRISISVGGRSIPFADFRHLPTRCRFIAFMPQWDFLDFLAERGRRYAGFDLRQQVEVTGLIEQQGRITGLRATTPQGELEVHADLVIGADGRQSIVRESAGLGVEDLGAPIDVLWMRLAHAPGDPQASFGYLNHGRMMVTLDRGDYWQCAYLIAKNSYQAIRAQGLPALRGSIARIAPFLQDRVGELQDWDAIKLLSVRVDRLHRWWRPGLLCIGDAAHALSPVGGVGINLAIQDAVAAANLLAAPLRAGRLDDAALAAVQARREKPTRWVQRAQVLVHDRLITRVLSSEGEFTPPWPLRLFAHLPLLRRIPARLVGLGLMRERVQTAEQTLA